MAFKSMKTYNDERYHGFFLLRNDGDFADVIFLYQNIEDVLVADVHYIKSAKKSGYVHCCGEGCPACAKGIRVQTKLFIPVYNSEMCIRDRYLRTIRIQVSLYSVFSVMEKQAAWTPLIQLQPLLRILSYLMTIS
mgnify:CR=1 FL=1